MLASLILTTSLAAPGSLAAATLRCEALVNPVGIATATPRLSWKLNPVQKTAYNLSQTGYRIVVGTTPGKADLWDTGRVNSDATFGIKYAGKSLASNQQVWWRVQVFDQAKNASVWSEPAKWSVGLLKPSDWKAAWVGFDAPRKGLDAKDLFDGANWIWFGDDNADFAAFTRKFSLRSGVKKAVLRITADDQFAMSVNGTVVGQSDKNTDAWRRPVEVDLVKAGIKAGENDITVLVSNTSGRGAFLAGGTITYADGQEQRLVTDEFWTAKGESQPRGDNPVRVVGKYGIGPWGKISPNQFTLPPARFLRSDFELRKPIKRAVLYGTAFGLLEMRLNGRAVSDELFMPGWTDYAKRIHVRGYDVTRMLQRGRNAVGVILGDGWYSGYVGYGGRRDHYGTKLRALVQLEVEHTDGTKTVVASNPNWKAAIGPIVESDFLMGELYDARKEVVGWDKAGFADKSWATVDQGAEMKPAVEMFPGQPVRIFAQLKAKSIKTVKPDTYVLDLGQNLAGFAKLKVQGKKGQKITLRFTERLNPDGTIYVTNLRGARTIDHYICKGEGIETWQPRFTFHGFQYIEVSGLGHKPTPDEVIGLAVSSETPDTGTIVTSDAMINRLVKNAWWTQKANFIDVPTDCPQRDERLGWTGDAQAYVRTASMLNDVQPFFTKWLEALDDAQRADGQYPMVAPLKVAEGDGGPAWADAGVICPVAIYDVYGDKELLARHYPQMKKFIEFCVKRSTPDLLPPKQFHCFGDWLNINDNTPNEVIYSAYFAGSARLVSYAASQLGKPEEAQKYHDLYLRLRAAFQKEYVTADGVVRGNSQCAYILALGFDLLDEAREQMAAKHLVDNIEKRGGHLSTGFVGTRDIMHVLSKIGRNDVAFKLLHNTTFPSWGFTIKNGATSIWERWDGWTPEKGFQDPGMNSFSHYAFGAVVGWMFDQPAGIQNRDPGFKTIIVAPAIDPKLTWLKSSYESVRGKIVSEWNVKNGKLTMRVVIPPNTTADVFIPTSDCTATPKVKLGEAPECFIANGLPSGEYTFTGTLRK